MHRSIRFAALALAALTAPVVASDHLDSPTVIADPRLDIGDVYAWMAPQGGRLNLVMAIVGHTFSERAEYVFHVDSGRQFGKTTASSTIACRFPQPQTIDCRVDDGEQIHGDASTTQGLYSADRRVRVFAGLRDDPFFNNVKGTRAAYRVAAAALKAGAPLDANGCAQFDAATVAAIRREWRQTDGAAARNFLAGWTPASLVVSIDRRLVAKGGDLLAVWGATRVGDKQIDRAARPLTGNALLGTIASDEESDRLKELYNAATPDTAASFIPEIEKGLALYDAFDGRCGNSLLAGAEPSRRYLALAALLADDRLWVNSAASVCKEFFAVELANVAERKRYRSDCGGRTPLHDAANIYRALLIDGSTNGGIDGLTRDENAHSADAFPFLAPVPSDH